MGVSQGGTEVRMDRSHTDPHDTTDLPPSLVRALVETAEYALRLRTGELIRFARAERHGAFVVLLAPGGPPSDPSLPGGMEVFPNGVEVRISEIVWCASGPIQGPDPETPSRWPARDLAVRQPTITPGVRVPLRLEGSDG